MFFGGGLMGASYVVLYRGGVDVGMVVRCLCCVCGVVCVDV